MVKAAADREQKWTIKSLNHDLIQIEQRNQDMYTDLRKVGLEFSKSDSLQRELELHDMIIQL